MANGLKKVINGSCEYQYHDGTYCGRPIDTIHSDGKHHCLFHSILESKKIEFDKCIKDMINKANLQSKKGNKILIDFEGFYFPGTFEFHDGFQCDISFRDAVFSDTADFEKCRFFGKADFKKALFQNGANFSYVIFDNDVYFEKTSWLYRDNRHYLSNLERVANKFPIWNFIKCYQYYQQYEGLVTFYSANFLGDIVDFSYALIEKALNFRKIYSNAKVVMNEAIIKGTIFLRGSDFQNKALCISSSFIERLWPIPKSFASKYNFAPKINRIKTDTIKEVFKGKKLFKESWIMIIFPIIGMLLLASRFKEYKIYVSDISTNLAIYHAIRFLFIGIFIIVFLSIVFISLIICIDFIISLLKFFSYRIRMLNSAITSLFISFLILVLLNYTVKYSDSRIMMLFNYCFIFLVVVYLMLKYEKVINIIYYIILINIIFIMYVFAQWYVKIEIKEAPVFVSFASNNSEIYYYANLIYTSEEESYFIVKNSDEKYKIPTLYKYLEDSISNTSTKSLLKNFDLSKEVQVIKIPRRELSKLIILNHSVSDIVKIMTNKKFQVKIEMQKNKDKQSLIASLVNSFEKIMVKAFNALL